MNKNKVKSRTRITNLKSRNKTNLKSRKNTRLRVKRKTNLKSRKNTRMRLRSKTKLRLRNKTKKQRGGEADEWQFTHGFRTIKDFNYPDVGGGIELIIPLEQTTSWTEYFNNLVERKNDKTDDTIEKYITAWETHKNSNAYQWNDMSPEDNEKINSVGDEVKYLPIIKDEHRLSTQTRPVDIWISKKTEFQFTLCHGNGTGYCVNKIRKKPKQNQDKAKSNEKLVITKKNREQSSKKAKNKKNPTVTKPIDKNKIFPFNNLTLEDTKNKPVEQQCSIREKDKYTASYCEWNKPESVIKKNVMSAENEFKAAADAAFKKMNE